jgi:sugar lactone lactonase YvrE
MKNVTSYVLFVFLTGTCNSTYSQIISTIAGNGSAAYTGDGGLATQASFNSPTAVRFDASGNLYVADGLNGVVRKISASTGIVTTIAGNGTPGYTGDGGPAINAELQAPLDLAIDPSGNIYIADYTAIRKITLSTGIISTYAGGTTSGFSGDGGPATLAEFNNATALAFDSIGNLYVSDNGNNRIRKITTLTGVITTIAGTSSPGYSGDNGPASGAQLNAQIGIALDKHGDLFIADYANERVRKITISSGIITTVAGNGIALNGGDGGPATSANLQDPLSLAFDASGNFYIGEEGHPDIRKVNISTGIITNYAGSRNVGFSGDGGSPLLADLNFPAGLCFDASGKLFFADANNNRIREITASTGITEYQNASYLKTYPNPNNGIFQVAIKNLTGQTIELSIFDMLGNEVVHSWENNNSNSSILKEIDLKNYPKGMYILQVGDGKSIITNKLVVQ